MNGRWVTGPGEGLFAALAADHGELPLVAEDLGTITADVEALLATLGLPGMKVLQFAFGGDAGNPYLPHNHLPNSVVYSGTHDNDTTHGWARSLAPAAREHALRYLRCDAAGLAESVLDATLASVSRWAVLPMQDLLGLGDGHRMNVPGTASGNWGWRFAWDDVAEGRAARWRARNELYGRLVTGG